MVNPITSAHLAEELYSEAFEAEVLELEDVRYVSMAEVLDELHDEAIGWNWDWEDDEQRRREWREELALRQDGLCQCDQCIY